jgi:hypothetical protein
VVQAKMSCHPSFSDSGSDAMSDDDSEPPAAIFDQPASAVVDNPKARFQKESTTPTPPYVAYMIVKQKASHQTPQLRPAII